MQAQIGRPIDVLLTQFSYANWVGNRGETERHRAVAHAHLERLKRQCEALSPSFVVPFASFVRFSHEENSYLNEGMNKLDDALDYLAANTTVTPVALYPGESWEVGTPKDNSETLALYRADYAAVSNGSAPLTASS